MLSEQVCVVPQVNTGSDDTDDDKTVQGNIVAFKPVNIVYKQLTMKCSNILPQVPRGATCRTLGITRQTYQ